ncbi:hypothetical protein QJQ45_027375, partial [Haematococcus lacustris]
MAFRCESCSLEHGFDQVAHNCSPSCRSLVCRTCYELDVDAQVRKYACRDADMPLQLKCPACQSLVPGGVQALQHLAPAAFSSWEQAETLRWLENRPWPRPCRVWLQPTASSAVPTHLAGPSSSERCSQVGQASPGNTLPRPNASAEQASAGQAGPPAMCYAGPGLTSPPAKVPPSIHDIHKAAHRFRCKLCSQDFCDACRKRDRLLHGPGCSMRPYHAGLTCQEAAAPDCLYCHCKVKVKAQAADTGARTRPMSQFHNSPGPIEALNHHQLDAVLGLIMSLVLPASCTLSLTLHLGLPWHCCVPGGLPTTTPSTPPNQECCCCWEPLRQGPCLQLQCSHKHLMHLDCARKQLKVRRLGKGAWDGGAGASFPGPSISFAHLFCPLCGAAQARAGGAQLATLAVHLDHPMLQTELQPELALRWEQHRRWARAKLPTVQSLALSPTLLLRGLEPLTLLVVNRIQEHAEPLTLLVPGGSFEGRAVDLALTRFAFYKCSKCQQPYCGGLKGCGAPEPEPQGGPPPPPPPTGFMQRAANFLAAARGVAAQAQAQAGSWAAEEPHALLCGSCCALQAGSDCSRHGTTFIEYKCKYCCRPAAWWCWGSTHMCDQCHADVGLREERARQRCDPA